MKSVNS